MYCGKCGTEMQNGKCPKCGNDVLLKSHSAELEKILSEYIVSDMQQFTTADKQVTEKIVYLERKNNTKTLAVLFALFSIIVFISGVLFGHFVWKDVEIHEKIYYTTPTPRPVYTPNSTAICTEVKDYHNAINGNNPNTIYQIIIDKDNVNIREQPSIDSHIIQSGISKGAKYLAIDIVDDVNVNKESTWFKVLYNDSYVYISTDIAHIILDSSTPPVLSTSSPIIESTANPE